MADDRMGYFIVNWMNGHVISSLPMTLRYQSERDNPI